ncbi:uncharacterized protein BDW43DRAFT_307720 [Aspergillus alliaceus]|uniref:uncharacterized protein n=1 Tax=Petromyces alliaceus TaxID=209559 RepID=UPI0012A5DDB0|nr:uncharacterized protein BDW43DRAFT_307720 [Aspergillus alliaceus]KAB8237445.1 hypothetical protein BDW43DRAFT_307720 [Aspergillus alliaceus]
MWWKRTPTIDYTSLPFEIDSNRTSNEASDLEKTNITHLHTRTRPHRRTWLTTTQNALFLLAGLLCLYISALAAWRTTFHPTTGIQTYYKKTLSCGNTTEEAESNGCEFDLLSHNWVPSPCVDHYIMNEFRNYVRSPERKYSAWPYYVDREGKDWIPDERTLALRANQHVVTTQEEHLAHCGFLIKRIHRAMLGITKADDIVSKYPHTVHCVEELMREKKKPLDVLTEGYWVGFSTCTVEVPL